MQINTLNAYSADTFDEAKRLGIQMIPGVELDVIYKKKQYHLLAYGIDIQNQRLRKVCSYNSDVQEAYNLSLLRSHHADFWSALDELLQTGIEGVECIHPLHAFGLQQELIALCNAKGLFISGGTDYHGHFFNKQKQTIGGQLINSEIVKRLIDSVKES